MTLRILALALLATGCANKLDQARIAWSEGEGDFAEAEPLYREAMENDRFQKDAKQELAAVYVQQARAVTKSKPRQADEYYRKALELEPTNVEALEGLGRLLMARGMPDQALQVVEQGASSGKCRPCKRLLTVLLLQRGDAYMAQQQYPAAEADYARSMAIIPNAAVALAIVRARLGRKDNPAAAEALKPAAAHITAADVDLRRQFLDLRRQIVLGLLAEDKAELADQLLDLAPNGVRPEEQLGFAIEVAFEFRKRGKPDLAIERMESLVEAADANRLKVAPERIAELRERVAGLYIARSAVRLGKNDISGADADLSRALQLRPGDPSLQLQRVLTTFAGKQDIVAAEAALAKIDAKTGGHAQVSAILMSARVHQLVDQGKLDAAKAELAKAKARAADLPEVHIAMADLLAASEFTPLKKKDAKELKARGLVKYPGKITRLGEALSELDWARQSIAGLGSTYPYRGPGTEARLAALQTELSASYPFAVKFQAEPAAVLVLANKGAAPVEVRVQRCTDAEAKVAPGTTTNVKVSEPGFCDLLLGGRSAAFVAEPYTQVELPL